MGKDITLNPMPKRATLKPRLCAREGCDVTFQPQPGGTGTKYCSDACRKLVASAFQARHRKTYTQAPPEPRPPHPFVVATDEAEQLVRQGPRSSWPTRITDVVAQVARLRGKRFAAIVKFALEHRLKLRDQAVA